MKKIVCLLVLLWKFMPSFAADDPMIKTGAQTFMNGYVAHLNAYLSGADDNAVVTKTTQDIRLPSAVIQASGVLAQLKSEEQVIQGFTGFLDTIKTQGVARIEWQDMQIKVLNPYAVVAHNTAVLLNERGEVLRALGGTYILHRQNDQWAIAMRIPHQS